MAQPQTLTSQIIQNYQNQIQNAGTLAQQKLPHWGIFEKRLGSIELAPIVPNLFAFRMTLKHGPI